MAQLSNQLLKAFGISILCISTVIADVMVVTLLGSGTLRPEPDRGSAAVLVEAGQQKLLFDAGRGVVQRIYQLGIDYNDIDKIFLTHLHYDHIIGLPDLMLSGWVFQRTVPLRVWGPLGTQHHLEHIQAAYKSDVDLRHRHTQLAIKGIQYQVEEIQAGVVYRKEDLVVTAISVDHGVVEHAFGYRIDYKGRSLVISGDTRYSKNIVKHAHEVDLLIHEIADASDTLLEANPRLQKVLSYHTTPDQLIRLLKQTNPRQTVLVHALIFGKKKTAVESEIRATYQGKVLFGVDLMAFDIGDTIRIYNRE